MGVVSILLLHNDHHDSPLHGGDDDLDHDDDDQDGVGGDADQGAWVRARVHCWRQSPIKAPVNSCHPTWSTFSIGIIIFIILPITIIII